MAISHKRGLGIVREEATSLYAVAIQPFALEVVGPRVRLLARVHVLITFSCLVLVARNVVDYRLGDMRWHHTRTHMIAEATVEAKRYLCKELSKLG